MRAQVEQYARQITQLETANKKLQSELREASLAGGPSGGADPAELSRLEALLEETREQLSSANNLNVSLEGSKRTMRNEVDDLNAQLDDESKARARLQSQVRILTTENAELSAGAAAVAGAHSDDGECGAERGRGCSRRCAF